MEYSPRSPVMWLDALSTSGPDTPKWVNSISPSSEKTGFFLPALRTVSVTLRSESPIISRQ